MLNNFSIYSQSSTAITPCILIALQFTDPPERTYIACVKLEKGRIQELKPGHWRHAEASWLLLGHLLLF